MGTNAKNVSEFRRTTNAKNVSEHYVQTDITEPACYIFNKFSKKYEFNYPKKKNVSQSFELISEEIENKANHIFSDDIQTFLRRNESNAYSCKNVGYCS